MNNIFTVTTIDKLTPINGIGNSRCVGWFGTESDAKYVVENNCGDIWEYSYQYAVIEKIGSGLYQHPKKEIWYKWNDDKKRYIELSEKPDAIKNVVNFGIG